jgi:predicted secreted hydrolase
MTTLLKPVIVVVALIFTLQGCSRAPDMESTGEPMELAAAMGGDTLGYARADGIREFDFPLDYAAHPDYKTEWWYFTGNIFAENGRRFGYELTLFRSALAPPDSSESNGKWATRQLYMGHFSLADPETGTFHAFERFSRGAAGLAGAESPPFRIWLNDWNMASVNATDDLFPLRLQAEEDGVAIDLTLEATKPVVLQGEQGWDPKGEGAGNASYYYSFTRMKTEGWVTVPDGRFNVQGQSWKDHEWSTSALGPDEIGWDWFALQLDDGREIMYYQLRRKDGSISPFTGGTLVAKDGSTRHLTPEDVELTVLDRWTSDVSGARYPVRWKLTLPGEDLFLEIGAVMPNQELNVSVRYWEGAVDIAGTTGGESLTGVGYVELTGYDGAVSAEQDPEE